jgi:hypothetical protein
MSHFTNIKTCFRNLNYLEKALNRLNITYKEFETNITSTISNLDMPKLVIPQSNDYNLEFLWNDEDEVYELVVDLSFWQQTYPIESFIDRVAKQYAGEVIIGESQKMGFQPIQYQQNLDGSNMLILERWNLN